MKESCFLPVIGTVEQPMKSIAIRNNAENLDLNIMKPPKNRAKIGKKVRLLPVQVVRRYEYF